MRIHDKRHTQTVSGSPARRVEVMQLGQRTPRGPYGARTPAPAGPRLMVTCWCEEGVCMVPASHVRQGITGSCGLPGCADPGGRD